MRTKVRSANIVQTKQGNVIIKIAFPYNEQDVIFVRQLEGRKFHSKGKFWTCPVFLENIERLYQKGFYMDNRLREILSLRKIDKKKVKPISNIQGLRTTPYPYQAEGIGYIESKRGRVLIADEMGLGKTLQALAYIQRHKELMPVLIVCPATLKYNWAQEIDTHCTGMSYQILEGKNSQRVQITEPILIINYDILADWYERLLSLEFKLMVCDEAHYIKNSKAKRTQAALKLGRRIPHVIGLTGTAIENRPIEIYNIVKLIAPEVLPSKWEFARRYCDLKHTGFGWDSSGASNIPELHEKLSQTLMIRRLKKDVLQDLPDKQYSFLQLPLDNQKEYNEAKRDFMTYALRLYEQGLMRINEETKKELVKKLKSAGISADNISGGITTEEIEYLKLDKEERLSAAGHLTQIEILKQVAAQGKLKAAFHWIKDFLESSNQKLIIFATHKKIISALLREFGTNIAVKIDGSTAKNKRQDIVNRFQMDKQIRLFVGNYKAAGVGITLTAASNVLLLEYPWTPGELSQAIDRAHRIGQKNAVNIYYTIARNTIEEKLVRMLDKKMKIVAGVLDGAGMEDVSQLDSILQMLD